MLNPEEEWTEAKALYRQCLGARNGAVVLAEALKKIREDERAAARELAIEECAKWHDEQAQKYDEYAVELRKWSDTGDVQLIAAKEDANAHRSYASAIRALGGSK